MMDPALLDFRLLFDSLPTPLLALDAATHTVQAANPACAAWAAAEPAALLGQPVHTLFGPDAAEAEPAAWPAWQAAAQRGTPPVLPPHARPLPHDPAAPPRFWQTTLTAAGPNLLLCRLLDVTERLAAEQQGQLSRQSYELLTDATHDGVWEADLQTGTVRRNAAFWRITGYEPGPDTATTSFWIEHVHPDDQAHVRQAFDEALAGDATVLSSAFRFRHRAGHWLDVLDRATIVRDAAGRAVRLLGAMQDLTAQRQAERELHRTTAHFQLIAEAQQQIVWLSDAAGQLLYINPYWQHYTGQQTSEPIDATGLLRLHPADRKAVRAAWGQSVAAGAPFEMQLRLRRHDGRYRWHLARAAVRPGPAGQPYWVGTATDVHDQKLTQRRLRRHDQRLLRRLDQLPLHLLLLRGPEHVVEYFSAQARPYLAAGSLGLPARQATPSPGPDVLGALDAAYHTGQAQRLPSLPVLPLDAAPDAAPHYLDVTLQPLRAPDGTVEGVLFAGLDTTEQHRQQRVVAAATAETRRQQEQFRFLAEFIPQLVWITDAAGHYEYFNERWTAYTGHTLTGAGAPAWRELIHADDRPAVRTRWQHALATGEYYETEYRFRAQDGSYRWFLSQALPLRDAGGRIVRWFGTNTDIDDAKRAQQQLEEKDRLLQQILSQLPAVVVTHHGPRHSIGFSNAPAQQLFGGRLEPGRDLATAAPEVAEQGFADLLDHVYASGQPYRGYEQLVYLPGSVANTPVAHYFDFTFQPLAGPDGQVQGVLSFAIDSTERVLARRRAAALDAEVQRRDRQLRLMTESLPVITFIVDAQGRTQYVSPQWYAHTGQDPATTDMDATWRGVLHPDDLPAIEQAFGAALASGTPWRYEFRLRRPDGQYRWLLSQGVPELDAAGRPVRWYGSNVDIHEQFELQEQLRHSEQRYELAALATNDAIWDWDLNTDALLWTEAVQRVFGYAAADVVPTIEWWRDFLVHPDDAARAWGSIRAALAAGHDAWQEEYRYRRANGTYAHVLDRGHVLRDGDGRPARMIGAVQDVTAEREAAAALRHSEAQFRFLAESIPQMVWTNDPAGNVDYVNQRWLDYTGYALPDSSGPIRWARVLHPADRPLMAERWQHALATGEFFEIEYRLQARTGAYRWFLGQARALRDDSGRIVRWFGTCTDIDDQKRAQQILQAQNDELTRINNDLDNFVYTASHDLRQPINNMAGIFEELTRTAHFRDPDAVKLVAMFERALQQIYDTIHDLSELVQVQKLRQHLPAEAVALAPLMAEVMVSIQDQLTAAQAQVTHDFAAAPAVRFVRPNLQSVLYNLVSNALKYAAPGRTPRVHLSSAPAAAGGVVLTVQDNGLGIDLARYGGQLFQLFRRFHNHVDGSGMGLYLVNRIVQSHGGRIEVASTVDEGTTFRVHLPG